MKLAVKIMLVLVIIAGAAGLIYLKLELKRMEQSNSELTKALAEARDRVSQFQERYKQQKALEANLLRTKLALEGRIGKMQAEIKQVQEENDLLRQDKNLIVKRLQAQQAELKKRYNKLVQQAQVLAAELEAQKQQYQQTIEAHAREVNQFKAEVKSLESGLSRTNFKLDRCVEHNRRLAEISEDLLFQYENKGFLSSFKQAEPFTQVERVEMEHMIQEYTEKIEKEKIAQ